MEEALKTRGLNLGEDELEEFRKRLEEEREGVLQEVFTTAKEEVEELIGTSLSFDNLIDLCGDSNQLKRVLGSVLQNKGFSPHKSWESLLSSKDVLQIAGRSVTPLIKEFLERYQTSDTLAQNFRWEMRNGSERNKLKKISEQRGSEGVVVDELLMKELVKFTDRTIRSAEREEKQEEGKVEERKKMGELVKSFSKESPVFVNLFLTGENLKSWKDLRLQLMDQIRKIDEGKKAEQEARIEARKVSQDTDEEARADPLSEGGETASGGGLSEYTNKLSARGDKEST